MISRSNSPAKTDELATQGGAVGAGAVTQLRRPQRALRGSERWYTLVLLEQEVILYLQLWRDLDTHDSCTLIRVEFNGNVLG